MAGAYSQDLRDRVIDAVEREGMSRRAAARRFGVSESAAIRWVGRYRGTRGAGRHLDAEPLLPARGDQF